MENSKKRVLAIDLGASSGRAIVGTFDKKLIHIDEIHRFSNEPVTVNGTMYWDILRLFYEIKQSLLKSKSFPFINSIAIDTWGVDYGLINCYGELIRNPVHYRDKRTTGMLEEAYKKIDAQRYYEITGNQFMEINTAFQLLSEKKNREEFFDSVDSILLMPDLFNYFLSKKVTTEISIASTTQLFDIKQKCWSKEVIEKLNLPQRIFPQVILSGTSLGDIQQELCTELEIAPIKVIAVAGHDTQSAMVATPSTEKDFIFLSCGTWSLMGTELEHPIIDEKSIRFNLTNEIGFNNKISFLKNIIGLWLIQESRRQWTREGKEFSFSDLEQMAQEAEAFRCFIDPDDSIFVQAGDIPSRIQQYCLNTGQYVPKNEGEIVRCIDESLAFKYRITFEEIKQCTNKTYETIHLMGGGAQSKLLCQMTADACNCNVSAGPIEATVLGNIAVQLITLGEIKDIKQARKIISQSQDIVLYSPIEQNRWESSYRKFKEVTKC